MAYDFTTRIDRGKTDSYKWKTMHEADPTVPSSVVPMSLADMEFVTQPEIFSLVRRMANAGLNLGYSAPSDGYFKAVLDWQESRHHFKAEREWVVPAPGVVPAVNCALRAFTNPGDGVVIQEPVYMLFRPAIERRGRVVVSNPLVLDATRYEMDFADLERKCADPGTRALILCSPHNPVGRVWTRGELRRLADICLANDVLIIADEIHNDLVLPPYESVSVMDVLTAEERERVILCTAPTKSFNIAGCKCANIFIPSEELRARFRDELMDIPAINLNSLAYPTCEVAYRECGAWLDELLVVLAQNRETLSSFFAANLPNVDVIPLEGTYLQWLDLRAWGMPEPELRGFLERDARLFVTYGSEFGTQGEGFVRMNIACPSQVLKETLSRLMKAAKARQLV